MKIVSYIESGTAGIGLLIEGKLYSLADTSYNLPADMIAFLQGGEQNMRLAREVEEAIKRRPSLYNAKEKYELLAPVPRPTSCRDGYAFRQHVAAARRNRGVPMIPEFDSYPIFYFTNHQAIAGPGDIYCMPDHFQKLDFELEVAVVIGKQGRNIKAADADSYIAGYMIMNDMSARTLQMEEMLLNLGPAKGKDFATVIGPWLVTPDELEPYKVSAKQGHTGNSYNLEMTCSVNGIEVSRGNMADMDWTFAEIIERCAYGCDIYPGDVIGSGTVGTGCFLELNGTGLLNDPSYQPQWLQPNDVVSMTVTGLGTLNNIIREEDTDWSILNLKKTSYENV
ncbi:MAG: fumarylacetoacetate hydrolase family protein [Sphingobacteriaceae bacterium]|nr:MAG: fumarylacetoacetate hydrolase family protein [Sphingobacteriaceae bacterium]